MSDTTEGNVETNSWVVTVLDTLCCCFRTGNKPKFRPLDTIKRFYSKTKGDSRESFDSPPESEPKVTLEQLESDPEFQKIVSEPISMKEKLRKALLLREQRINELRGNEESDIEIPGGSKQRRTIKRPTVPPPPPPSPPQSGAKVSHSELENDPEYKEIMSEPIPMTLKLNKIVLLREQRLNEMRDQESSPIEPNNRMVPQSNNEISENSEKRRTIRPTEPPPPPPIRLIEPSHPSVPPPPMSPPSNTSSEKSMSEGRGGKWGKRKAPPPPPSDPPPPPPPLN